MPLAESLIGDDWTHETARKIIPILVWCAENGTKISYGGLNNELVARGLGHSVHAAAYGYPAGTVGDALEETSEDWPDNIPPLNALIVNKSTGMPGHGVTQYLLHFKKPGSKVRKLSNEDRFAIAEDVIADVHGYRNWRKLLKHYRMQPIVGNVINAVDNAERQPIALPKRTGIGGGGVESQDHQNLKDYVKNNPKLLKEFGQFNKGTKEVTLQSGDRVDVFFENDLTRLVVEVKAANVGLLEITRGIFQCVKYRAVLRAEQKAEILLPNANAVLITKLKLTVEQQKLRKRLNVPVIELD
jgi:hypothetical protein